jgi:transposase-like protein
MPEVCPHCSEPVDSERKTPDSSDPYEVWRCESCDEEWRHPEETVLSQELDFSQSETQLSRRGSNGVSEW